MKCDRGTLYREPAAVSVSPSALGYFLTDSFGPLGGPKRADYMPGVTLSYLFCCHCTRSIFDTPAALFETQFVLAIFSPISKAVGIHQHSNNATWHREAICKDCAERR